jgi:hypothetical protein
MRKFHSIARPLRRRPPSRATSVGGPEPTQTKRVVRRVDSLPDDTTPNGPSPPPALGPFLCDHSSVRLIRQPWRGFLLKVSATILCRPQLPRTSAADPSGTHAQQ